MPLENNLPQIQDTATETEDGLMSYQDKIKLDRLDESLNTKLSKSDKIPSSQLDTSSDNVKIQPENLSDAVKRMMTGQASVEATVPNNGVTTEKVANNAITIDKIDKRVILANVVSPRPLNFAFDSKKVTINIPQGSLLLTDGTTKRNLVTGCDVASKTININYPTDFTGLNYIVSDPSGTLNLINYRKASTISNTVSIMALVTLSSTFESAIIMNGNYTINGLAQGVGTESAALLSEGKIVFDKQTGIIEFTEAPLIHLIIGGVFNRSIQSQASIRLSDYSSDSIYNLYWDNATSSLKTALTTATNDTDINKIAMIKDGRIIPYVDTGIYYSKPYIAAPYYTETFDLIGHAGLISNTPLNIITEGTTKLEFKDETYVFLKQKYLLVNNQECTYTDREGLHFILFNLDDQTLSCRHYKTAEDTTKKNVVIATMWISEDKYPEVSGSLTYTVDNKSVYQNDLNAAQEAINTLENITESDLSNNRILSGNELFMINGEELPLYISSMILKETEGVKPFISYKKKGSSLAPINEVVEGSKLLLSDNLGTDLKLSVSDKYKSGSYLTKTLKINKVNSNHKNGQSIKILCLGDDLINDKTAYYIKTKLASLGVTANMLGTMVNSQVYGEGRDGWFYSTFVGASGRGYKEGKINPQTSKGSSSILLNPFLRTANADDKANHPNDCYRATGAYIEKNYYNDSNKTGAFYIFDFAKYMEVQGIVTPDVVVIALKPEMIKVFTEDIVSTNMIYLKQLVAGIRAALPDTFIALVPQYGSSTVYPKIWESTNKIIDETVKYVEGLRDSKIRVISSWLHMCRELGTADFTKDLNNDQLYKEYIYDPLDNTLSEDAKIELANSIAAFIMNI